MRVSRSLLAGASVVSVAVLVAACSSSRSPTSTSAGSSTTPGGTSSSPPPVAASSGGSSPVAASSGGSSPVAASSGAAASTPNLTGQKLEVVIEGSPEDSRVVEYHALNLLKQWGASVKIDYAQDVATAYALMLRSANILSISLPGGEAGVESGLPLEVVGLEEPRQDYVFMAKNSIASPADLKGAKVGVLDTVGVNYAQAILVLDAGNLTASNVHFVNAGGQGSRTAALAAGRVDGTMLSHSAIDQLGSGFHVIYDYTKQQPKLYDDVAWVNKSFAAKNSTVLVAYNRAFLESYVWFNDPANDAHAVQEVQQAVQGTDASGATKLYDTLRAADAYPKCSALDTPALQYQQTIYLQAKAYTKNIPLSQWTDTSFAQQAAQAEGCGS